jgi:hypothetical protein
LGKDWFDYLLHQAQVPFRIRIRESDQLSDGRKLLKAKVVFQSLHSNQQQVLRRRRLWGRWVFVAGLRLEDQSLLIVVSSDSPDTAISDYAQRWGVETLFGIFAHSRILFRIIPSSRSRTAQPIDGTLDDCFMLGVSYGRVVSGSKAHPRQKAWTQSSEHFSLWIRSSA